MFTLLRPLAALGMALLAYLAATAYRPLDERIADAAPFEFWLAIIAAAVGWRFLGGRIGGALWHSVFVALQAVVLAAVLASALFAVQRVFVMGYARRYREPMEAFTGYFEIIGTYLMQALDRDFLLLLGLGGVVLGLVLHLLQRMLEARRLNR